MVCAPKARGLSLRTGAQTMLHLSLRPVWEIAVHLAVAGNVFEGLFLCCLFPARCLGLDLGLNLVSF